MFSLSILLLPLLAGAYASNVLDLDPSNFDSIIGQGKPGLVELYVALLDLLRAVFDVSPASHHGGTSLSSRRTITLNRLVPLPSGHCKVIPPLNPISVTVVQEYVTQSLAPIYEQLADAFGHAKDKVVVAKVDADGLGKPLGQKYGVTGFPSAWSTLKTLVDDVNCNSSEMVRLRRLYLGLRRGSGP
jgi:protein disulfide-isomerase A6